jgi:hypothetical protein
VLHDGTSIGTCGILVPSNIFLKPEQVTLKYINDKVFKVGSITHEPLSAGQKGALSAMGRIKLNGEKDKTAPESIVVKCLPRKLSLNFVFAGGVGGSMGGVLIYFDLQPLSDSRIIVHEHC